MKQNDKLKDWFRELPEEQPSPDFTRRVMEQVMAEWRLNPVKYQPIISKKGWWTIGVMAFLLTTVLSVIHTTVSDTVASSSSQETLYGIDLTKIFTPFSHFFEKLSDISPAFAIGILAIIALWFFDQLFIRTVRR